RFAQPFQSLAIAGGLVAWLGFSHYVYGGQPLLPYTQMAIHTAVCFLLLSVGILCTRPEIGLVALLTNSGPAVTIARGLIPAVFVMPFIIGWLRLQGQRAGWYGTEAGISLSALVNVLVFGGLIWANAALLRSSDGKRALAERKFADQLEKLNLLHQITRAIGGREDLRSIYQVVLRTLEENLAIDFGCICDYDASRSELTVIHVGVGSQPLAFELAFTEQARIPVDANGLSRCVQGNLVYEPDISEVKMPFPQNLHKAGLRSLVIAPLLFESRVLGVFIAARRDANSFSSAQCEFLRQLSEHVALAAHQAQLHASLQEAYDDLRRTQQAIMQQERLRALGQMASGIAHDINNAISPMVLYTEMLLEKEASLTPQTRKHLEIIQRAANDVAKTVSRMREFARQREPQLNLAPVPINDLIQQVAEMTRPRWSDIPMQQGVSIEILRELAPDPPPVMGVESEIREALINLVFNAVDAMPAGGTLTVRTRVTRAPKPSERTSAYPARDLVSVEVSDTGVGMDDETRRRCFEPFFTTKGERGTGLGLAMVYGVVQRHSGNMEIESRVGSGTTIRLTFAAASPIKSVAIPSDAALKVPSGKRVLVVDDDPLLLRALIDILEHDGHQVVAANGGQAGIEAFSAALAQHNPFAVVITDLGMPRVDGRAVASSIKACSKSTPVILLTGWGERLIADGDIPPHVDRVLAKPPKLRDLREAIATGISTEQSPDISTL
ncbi:MAG TPA: ATP-binding protein, partial [Sphingomicrobium sp.]|nr:ATP-binding protein [Sphingomicrobium sp.]